MNLSIPKDVFDAAWEVLDASKKKTLMIGHLDILQANDFEVCFAGIGKPYLELTDRSRRHNVTMPDSEEHRKLAMRLQQVDYITSFDSNGHFKEFDHALRKMVDRPAILCRVKADGNGKGPEKK